MIKPFTLLGVLALTTVGACSDALTVAPSASVRFVIDAPLCSSIIPVQLSIDNVLVGADTFRVAVTSVHLTTRAFLVAPGAHTLGARVPGGYTWSDRTVMFAAGDALSDSLPFYCS